MEDLRVAAWMLRYGARSLAHNLRFIPADRENWKPEPGTKSALEIATEVLRGLRMYRPILDGPEYPDPKMRMDRAMVRVAVRRNSDRCRSMA